MEEPVQGYANVAYAGNNTIEAAPEAPPAQGNGSIPGAPPVDNGLRVPEKKQKVKPTPAEQAGKSDGVELHRVIVGASNEEMWALILEALQIQRINVGADWRLFKVKNKCWLLNGLTLTEREVLYAAPLKLREKFMGGGGTTSHKQVPTFKNDFQNMS